MSSFDRQAMNPNAQTHVPVRVEIPIDDVATTERAVIPPPSLWQEGVKVRHKTSGRENIVRAVDHMTCMFRPVYDEQGSPAPRTHHEQMSQWDVVVELSPLEKERDLARQKLEAEIASLSPDDLASFQVLVDDPDPAKAMAKLEAMRRMGILGGTKKGK
jgi:hypothetical protein